MSEKNKVLSTGLVYTKNTEHLVADISRACMLPIYQSNVQVFGCSEIRVFILQKLDNAVVLASTVTNDDWMELLFLLDALREAKNIILCVPYCGYFRQDKTEALSSRGLRTTQHLIENFGNISHCIFIDTHVEPIVQIPTTHLHITSQICADIRSRGVDCVVVSPDFGGIHRSKSVADMLNMELIVCDKKRNIFGQLTDTTLIGDVKNKHCVSVDDIIDSGFTICATAEKLIENGALDVRAYVTHALLNNDAINMLKKSCISEVVISNTLPIKNVLPEKFRVLPINSLIIETIHGIVL